MSTNYISADRNTLFLFPPSVQDWLPEDHLARFVVDIVAQLDLRPIVNHYGGRGSKAYHPQILLALIFYGYATGIFSSRKIEQATYDSVAFRYIAANTHPDHDTIATFRKRFLKELQPLFVQILIIAKEIGLLKLGKVSLDGTKVTANASKHHALSWKHACRIEKQLQAEVEELMRLGQQADSTEKHEGMNIPQELARRQDRLEAITAAKEKIKQRADERFCREQQKYEQKVVARKEKSDKTGKKPRGPKPKPPTSGPSDKEQVNLTDEESRIMPSSKGFVQAYNAQAGVDLDSMIIVSSHVSQSPNDKLEIEPAIAALTSLPETVGEVNTLIADSGYFSEANVKTCSETKIEPLIATGRQQHHQTLQERFGHPQPLPENAGPVDTMRHRLKTDEGRRLYAKRKSTVEPVFGIIKQVMGFRQFHVRGHEAVSGEWLLTSIAWNLKRMFALSG